MDGMIHAALLQILLSSKLILEYMHCHTMPKTPNPLKAPKDSKYSMILVTHVWIVYTNLFAKVMEDY
jgi:hypothetical protein